MKPYQPTPKQIRKATKKIREKWNERTYLIRKGFSPEEADKALIWTAPLFSEPELLSIMRELGDL